MLSDFLGLLAIGATIKGLGGSFNVLFDRAAISFFHGPVVGTGVALLLGCYFFFFKTPAHNVPVSPSHRKAFWGAFMVLLLGAGYLKGRAILLTPMDVMRADPLFIVEGQLQHLFEGLSPYTKIQLPNGHWIHHGYLPGIWLSYLPLYGLHLDLRYLNLFGHLLFYGLLASLFLKKGHLVFERFWPSALLFLAVLALHIFSKQTLKELIDIQTGGFWIALSLFLWAAATERFRLATACTGWILLCREPAFLFVVPYFWYLFQTNRKRGRAHALVVGVAVVMLMAPWLLWDARGFFAGMRYYSTVGGTTEPEMMARFYGLSGVLKQYGLYGMPMLYQLGGVGLTLGSLWFLKPPSLPKGLGRGASAYVSFILFVTITYQYLFAEPLLLAYFLLVWPARDRV